MRYANGREEAEDYLQEGFLKIFRDIHQFDASKASFYTWAKKVVINTALEHIRKKDRRPILGELGSEVQIMKYDQDVVSHLSTQELYSYIDRLPLGYKAVFNMYVIDGYNHREIAEKLSISESTSKSQLFKARNRLIEMIREIKQKEIVNVE